MGLLICFGRRPEDVQGTSGKPPACVGVRQLGHKNSFARDCRAAYGANGGASAPKGAVLSFEVKESTKESLRHGDYGKKPFIAHFDGGARNVARNGVG